MAAKIRITYDFDTWDAAVISSSSEATTDLVDDNVVDDIPGKPWRSSTDTSEWIKFDLGSAKQIKCVGIFNHNFTSGATVKLQANASDSWGSPTLDQTLTIATDEDSVVLKSIVVFVDQTLRWWRITIDDAANADTFIQIGRVAGGVFYEPTRNFNDKFAVVWNDPSERIRVPGAMTKARSRDRFRTIRVAFSYINQTETDKLSTIFTKVGMEKPLIISLDPTDRPTKASIYCTMVSPLTLMNVMLTTWDAISVTFEEKVR